MNKKVIIFSILGIVVLYLLVWTSFITDGFVITGDMLVKSDWLSFIGSYLGFIGTVLLGALALYQNEKLGKTNDRLLRLEENQYGCFLKLGYNSTISFKHRYTSIFKEATRGWYDYQKKCYFDYSTSKEITIINFTAIQIKDILWKNLIVRNFSINGKVLPEKNVSNDIVIDSKYESLFSIVFDSMEVEKSLIIEFDLISESQYSYRVNHHCKVELTDLANDKYANVKFECLNLRIIS